MKPAEKQRIVADAPLASCLAASVSQSRVPSDFQLPADIGNDGFEKQGAVNLCGKADLDARRPRYQFTNQYSSSCRTVALPQLVTPLAIVGSKIEQSVDVDEILHVRTTSAGLDIFEQERSGRCTVGAPQLFTESVRVRREISHATHFNHWARKHFSVSLWIDVFDQLSGQHRSGLEEFGS